MRNKNARVSNPNDFVTSSGHQYHIIYSPVVLSDGSIELVESGKDDIQEMIQSFKSQTDMSYILQRMAVGDTSVLNQRTPMYGDFTQMPKTYAEALQLVIDREKQFMELPVNVRNQFDNDFKKWFATSGSEEWFKKMDSVIPKEKKEPVIDFDGSQEVKESES